MEGDPDEAEIVAERKRTAEYARMFRQEHTDWWSPVLPHPLARAVTLGGRDRDVTVRFVRGPGRWTAVMDGAHHSMPAGGESAREAIINCILREADADELMESLDAITVEP